MINFVCLVPLVLARNAAYFGQILAVPVFRITTVMAQFGSTILPQKKALFFY